MLKKELEITTMDKEENTQNEILTLFLSYESENAKKSPRRKINTFFFIYLDISTHYKETVLRNKQNTKKNINLIFLKFTLSRISFTT